VPHVPKVLFRGEQDEEENRGKLVRLERSKSVVALVSKDRVVYRADTLCVVVSITLS